MLHRFGNDLLPNKAGDRQHPYMFGKLQLDDVVGIMMGRARKSGQSNLVVKRHASVEGWNRPCMKPTIDEGKLGQGGCDFGISFVSERMRGSTKIQAFDNVNDELGRNSGRL